MNYIYDITLNLNKNKLYEFYEWKEDDEPEFILKIPIFRVDKETFLDIKNNEITVDKSFLSSIEDKTESYFPNGIGVIRYACIFSYDDNCVAIEFDSEGNNYMKSNISIDEEYEIANSLSDIKYNIVDYKVKKKNKINNNFFTRNEQELLNYISSKIESMKENNENSKLKYLFYELYEEKCDDIEKICNKLINSIKIDNNKFKKLNNILTLSENSKL